MSLHPDFVEIKADFVKRHGSEKGEKLFFSFISSKNFDDSKSFPDKKSFLFSEGLEIKSEGENFFVEGVASTSNPDLGNDVVSESALMQMADQINAAADTNPISLGYDHTELLGGKPNTVPLGHLCKAWVENSKLFIKGTINKALSVFNEAKSALERKDLNAYSIEYIADPKRTRYEVISGVKHRMIDGLKLIGMALTGRPMNKDSYASFYVKHLVGGFNEDINIEVKEMVEEEKAPKEKKEEVKEEVESPKEEAPAEETKKVEEEKPVKEDEKVDVKSMVDAEIKRRLDSLEVKNKPKLNDEPKFEAKSEETPLIKAAIEMKNNCMDSTKKLSVNCKGEIDVDHIAQFKSAAKLHTEIASARKSWDGVIGGSSGLSQFEVTGPAGQDIQMKHVELKAWSDGSGPLEETTNKSDDTDYLQATAELNDIYGPAVINILNDKTTTFGLLRKVDASGRFGEKYGDILRTGRNSSAQEYGAGDITTASIADRQERIKIQQPFMRYGVLVQVDDKLIADGRGAGSTIGDIWADEIRFGTMDMRKLINEDLFDITSPSNGFTAGGKIMSLGSLCGFDGSEGSDQSLYGRSQDVDTGLRCATIEAKSTTDVQKVDLRLIARKVEINGAEKGNLVFITGQTQRDKILGLLDEHQRINGTSPRAGFEGLPTFDGIPIHADVDCEEVNAGYIYCIDTSHTFIIVQQAATVVELAKTGDERRALIKTYLNLFCNAPGRNAVITGLKTT